MSAAIEKTRKKAGMLLNGCTDRRKTNSTIYIKLWRKVCLPTLLDGAELWTLKVTGIRPMAPVLNAGPLEGI